jgi:hypothetical protein
MQTESISYLQVEILGLDVNANWKHKLAHVYPLWICVMASPTFFLLYRPITYLIEAGQAKAYHCMISATPGHPVLRSKPNAHSICG